MSRSEHETNIRAHMDNGVLKTYAALRWTLVGLGLGLVSLPFGAAWFGWFVTEPFPLHNSLSVYYHAGLDCVTHLGVYRNFFVGFLVAISVCLMVYGGTSHRENWLLNIAGVLLIGVALVPTNYFIADLPVTCPESAVDFKASAFLGLDQFDGLTYHNVFAGLFFVFIALTNFYTATDTIKKIRNTLQTSEMTPEIQRHMNRKKRLLRLRWITAAAIMIPWLINSLLGNPLGKQITLWLEVTGILAFCFYWALKSVEILSTAKQKIRP